MKTNKNIINNDQIKIENRHAVLKLLSERGAMSRSELAQALNCDGTTITHIIRFLMEEGVVKSLGHLKPNKKRGRPQELICLNEGSCCAIGISFSPYELIGVLIDFSGNIIFQEQICFEKNIKRNSFIELLKKITRELLSRVNNRRLLGLGLGTFGIYSREKKCVIQAEYFPAVCDINFEELFQNEYGITPDIIDGTFAVSTVESYNRRNNMPESFILLDVSIGIGAAIFINSRPLSIGKGLYSEFGHSILKPDGDACIAGHSGCLETIASIPAIIKKVSQKLNNNDIDFEYILKQYLNNDPTVVEVVNEASKWLGVAITNLVNLFSPQEIIFSGMSAKFGKTFLDTIEETVRKSALLEFSKNVSFSLSKLDKDATAHGVALVQVDSFLIGNVKFQSLS